MKFLEIADGEAIKIDSIDKIERVNELNCRLICGFNTYDVTLPYAVLIDIVEQSGKAPDTGVNTQLLQDISRKVGNLPVFAG